MSEKRIYTNKPRNMTWQEYNENFKNEKKKRNYKQTIKKIKLEEKEKAQTELANEILEKSEKFSTLSIAVPGSILENAQSLELRTYLAGQIARAACIYKADEVIVFDDIGDTEGKEKRKVRYNHDGTVRASCEQLGRILQYLECPQYLRKFFFPIHSDLKYAGLLNPLDAPHHLRQNDVSLFREGVVQNKPLKQGHGSMVNVGLLKDVHVDKIIEPGVRVTVKIPPGQEEAKKLRGTIVFQNTPQVEEGIYWGYSVTLAKSLSDIFAQCKFKDGYDLIIGTSDKGLPIDDVPDKSLKHQHALVVFGGLAGLEAALEADKKLDISDPSLLFTHYLNTCPSQGSRTIRTEEAILVSLAELRRKLEPKYSSFRDCQFNDSPVERDEGVKEES